MKDYHINLFWSDKDACWVADIPDLKYGSAFGEEAAVREIGVAKEAWLEAARKAGDFIPEPRYRPVIYQVAR